MDGGLQFVKWEDIRNDVIVGNQKLAAIIDEIGPPKNYKLVLASYNFGDLIVKDGITQVRVSNQLVPVTSQNLPKQFINALTYSFIPFGLLLNKSSEVFLDVNNRTIPLRVLSPGDFFGVFEVMDFICGRDSSPVWSVSSGTRTIFTLPKITRRSEVKKLRKYFNIPSNIALNDISDHWQIFKYIAHHPLDTNGWQSKVLFFTKEWFNHQNDEIWFKFYQNFYQKSWVQSQYAIGKIEFSLIWQQFMQAITDRNLKPRPYLSDTAKHLLLIASKSSPVFIPSVSHEEISAPIQKIQEAIVDIYSLEKYFPSIIRITSAEEVDGAFPVYYPLSYPTLLEGVPVEKRSPTVINDLREIKLLMDVFNEDQSGKDSVMKKIKLDYFHSYSDPYNEISSSKLILHQDKRFLEGINKYPGRKFCDTSSFWKGCIRFSSPSGKQK